MAGKLSLGVAPMEEKGVRQGLPAAEDYLAGGESGLS